MIGQIARFGIAGAANVGVDLSVYTAFLFVGAPIWVAKAIAFICGTLFSYWANKTWTFRVKAGGADKFVAVAGLYAFSMALNVGLNSLIISLIGDSLFGRAAGYCCALIVSAAVNFIGMREILVGRKPAAAG